MVISLFWSKIEIYILYILDKNIVSPEKFGFVMLSLTSQRKNFSEYQPSGAGGTRSPPATPHRLQRRTACQWAPKWPTGSGKGSNPRLLGAPVNFC